MLYDYSGVYAEMPRTIAFIRELLSATPSLKLESEAQAGAEPMEIENELTRISFNTIDRDGLQFAVCAVDGGQGTILRATHFKAVIYRAGCVVFLNKRRSGERLLPLRLENISSENLSQICAGSFFESYQRKLEITPEFSEAAGFLRGLAEQDILNSCLAELSAGDLLLLDGSLRCDGSGFLESFLERAAGRQIDIAAVSKASSILWRGGAGLTAVIKQQGDLRLPGRSWYARVGQTALDRTGKFLGEIYIGSLNAFSPVAFRIDLSRLNHGQPARIFAQLAAYAGDACFPGYPYPLAAVHQMVRVSQEELSSLAGRLQDLAGQAGISRGGWELLFNDYHAVLNRDISQTQ